MAFGPDHLDSPDYRDRVNLNPMDGVAQEFVSILTLDIVNQEGVGPIPVPFRKRRVIVAGMLILNINAVVLNTIQIKSVGRNPFNDLHMTKVAAS